jgi:hypothetical protein
MRSFFAAALLFASPLVVSGIDYWQAVTADDWLTDANVTAAKGRKYGAGFRLEGDEIVVANADAGKNAGAGWTVKLRQKEPQAVRFSAEALVSGAVKGERIQLFADVNFVDGTVLNSQTSRFACDSALGWQRRELELVFEKPIEMISLYVMMFRTSGEVRFRNVRFDTLKNGTVAKRLDTVLVKNVKPPSKSGLYLRDAAKGDGFAAVPESGELKGLKVVCRKETRGAVRLFDVKVESADRSADRAVTALFAVPLPSSVGVWHEDPRTDVELSEGQEHMVWTAVPYGAGRLSKWPLGAVTSQKRSVAIGLDPEWPAVYRIAVNPSLRIMFIAFDLGLAPQKSSARVKFSVFPFDGDRGMRAALTAYGKIYPMAFSRRIPEVGAWQVATSISSIAGHEDFGFKYMEGGGTWKWDDAHGIYTFKYTEPGSWWMGCGERGKGLPTIEACIEMAQGWLNQSTNARNRARAEAWATSVARDELGRPVGRIQEQPWTYGIMWCMNSAPGINGGDNDYWTKNSKADYAERYAGKFPEGVDGEYIDSSEMCFNFGCDYDRNHFAGMETPLCFGMLTKRVCVAGAMASYEYARTTSRRLKELGRYTMANSTPYRTSMLVPFIDVPGTEIKWYRAGRWTPSADRDMIYMRAVSGRKPYCLLQNTEFDEFHGHVEKYMQRSLAYGMISGFFSSNGYTDCYYSKRERYEIDRPMFRKYIPLQIELAKAGWTAIATLAESSSPGVFVEQFGERYITLFNPSRTEPATAKISSVRRGALERVTGEKWDFSKGALGITLPPETVRMLDFGE